MSTPSQVADQLAAEAAGLDREIAEIDLLVTQATTESSRHEARRVAAADKFAKLTGPSAADETVDLANQLVTLTRRAGLMDAQLEILEGKKRSIARLRESILAGAAMVREIGDFSPEDVPQVDAGDDGAAAPAISRLVLNAQEDLRREIARAMHDGPAQSLTNIVLQAEIVERLVVRDPQSAADDVRQLVAMVQQTLEATKSFIFDVRPMVLDDLGLMPTLRRSARERGQRAGIEVAFESVGVDRRLSVELESGLFRIADEALAAYLAAGPDRASLGLDWGDALVLTVRAERAPRTVPGLDIDETGEALPPALAAMVADRRAQHEAATRAAKTSSIVKLPEGVLGDLRQRATTVGIRFEVLEEGASVRLSAELPALDSDGDAGGAVG